MCGLLPDGCHIYKGDAGGGKLGIEGGEKGAQCAVPLKQLSRNVEGSLRKRRWKIGTCKELHVSIAGQHCGSALQVSVAGQHCRSALQVSVPGQCCRSALQVSIASALHCTNLKLVAIFLALHH